VEGINAVKPAFDNEGLALNMPLGATDTSIFYPMIHGMDLLRFFRFQDNTEATHTVLQGLAADFTRLHRRVLDRAAQFMVSKGTYPTHKKNQEDGTTMIWRNGLYPFPLVIVDVKPVVDKRSDYYLKNFKNFMIHDEAAVEASQMLRRGYSDEAYDTLKEHMVCVDPIYMRNFKIPLGTVPEQQS
jgi:hypothetical protein